MRPAAWNPSEARFPVLAYAVQSMAPAGSQFYEAVAFANPATP